MTTLLRSKLALLPLLVACSGTPGTKPHDMSSASHEQAAREHKSAIANVEDACQQKRRNQLTTGPGVPTSAGSEPADTPYTPCWQAADRRVVDAHANAAAKHRTASAELRDAEARACAGISSEDRDMSPFERVADIANVEPLVEQVGTPKLPRTETVGAIVTFRAVPGLTAEWLQRIVDCHLARNAALGHVVPEMPNCPLVPRGVHARVRSVGNGFAVEIRGDDAASVREIRARAERLIRRDRTAVH
jgi:hypothetical protein